MSECDSPLLRAEGLVKTHHGAGKSTLLHLLGGLQRPDEGSIWLDGERADGWSEARWAVERRRRIGIVFQFFNLVSDLIYAAMDPRVRLT